MSAIKYRQKPNLILTELLKLAKKRLRRVQRTKSGGNLRNTMAKQVADIYKFTSTYIVVTSKKPCVMIQEIKHETMLEEFSISDCFKDLDRVAAGLKNTTIYLSKIVLFLANNMHH